MIEEADRTKLSGLDGYVTIEEVGRIIGKPYWTARRWIDVRGIRRKVLGHSYLVRIEDVQREIARYGSEM